MKDQKQQEPALSLMESLNLQQEKSKGIYGKVEGCIDKMIHYYTQAAEEMAKGKDQKECLEELSKNLISVKPIKNVRDHFVHFYRKLSAFVKEVQDSHPHHNHTTNHKNGNGNLRHSKKRLLASQTKSEVGQNGKLSNGKMELGSKQKVYQFFEQYMSKIEDYELMQKMLCEHFMRQGQWGCADIFAKSDPIEIEVMIDESSSPNENLFDGKQLFMECLTIKGKILQGDYCDAIKWTESQRIFETYGILLEYQLKKMHILQMIKEERLAQSLQYYRQTLPKFHHKKSEELPLFLGYILFSTNQQWRSLINSPETNLHLKQQIQQRYSMFTYDQKCKGQLAAQFVHEYFRHYKLSKFDSVRVIFDTSQRTMGQYAKYIGYMCDQQGKPKLKKEEGSKTLLPFSIKLQKQCNYHSLFLCPVSKEVCSSKEGVVLLSCGHLISQAASLRIIADNRGRKKIKCPICQKEIRIDDHLSVQF